MKSVKVYLMMMGLLAVVAATGCKTPVGERKIYGYGSSKVKPDMPDNTPMDSTNTIKPTTEPVANPIPDMDLSKWTADKSAFEAQTIYFSYDSTALKAGEKTKAQIVAAYLQSNPRNAVRVEGHCDERGTEEYNRSLGSRRALAAREALVASGIDPQRIDIVTFGEDQPADPAHNEVAWKKNRRAAFVLLTPLQQ